jgi:hypothetical protein
MQERVNLEELNRDLSAAQARVERWAHSKVSSATELKENHAVNVENLRGRSQLGSTLSPLSLFSNHICIRGLSWCCDLETVITTAF